MWPAETSPLRGFLNTCRSEIFLSLPPSGCCCLSAFASSPFLSLTFTSLALLTSCTQLLPFNSPNTSCPPSTPSPPMTMLTAQLKGWPWLVTLWPAREALWNLLLKCATAFFEAQGDSSKAWVPEHLCMQGNENSTPLWPQAPEATRGRSCFSPFSILGRLVFRSAPTWLKNNTDTLRKMPWLQRPFPSWTPVCPPQHTDNWSSSELAWGYTG